MMMIQEIKENKKPFAFQSFLARNGISISKATC